jgi:CRP-like cAMP-binding protein
MIENKLLSSLPKDERERLQPYLHAVSMNYKQLLIEYDQPIGAVWFPHDAITSTVVDTVDGSRIEVGLMGYDGMVGLSLLFGVQRSNTTVLVQIPGQGTTMSARHFAEHVVRPGGPLKDLLLVYVQSFMAMMAQTAACNSLHQLQARMCRWILMVHDRVERAEFPLTQDFLAIMLGVHRPGVTLVAGKLQEAGVIRYTRGSITIVDRQKLEQGSCECYSFIKEQTERIFSDQWRYSVISGD